MLIDTYTLLATYLFIYIIAMLSATYIVNICIFMSKSASPYAKNNGINHIVYIEHENKQLN